MTAWAPTTAGLVAATAVVVATLLAALGVSRLRPGRVARVLAWALTVGSVLLVERLVAREPPGFRMLAIIGVLLYGMKAVVSVEAGAQEGTRLSTLRWLAFAALWPGMRPSAFGGLGSVARPGAARLLVRGASRLVAGGVLVLLARVLWTSGASTLAATVALLPGLSLVLHFGLFDLAAGVWRRAGADAQPLFQRPLASRSLREFWGRRWNLAFSEMTAFVVYRPLAPLLGRPGALLAAFAFSGLLHELAISVPVRAGYGLPLLYFLLHGTLVLREGRLAPAGRGWSRAWTIAALVLPLPLLFHRPFLAGVLWPLLGARG